MSAFKKIESITDLLEKELVFSTSRSSGPGGQHVNKTNTKVELRFAIENSNALNESMKIILLSKLRNRINNEGELIIVVQEERSQIRNKEIAIQKFFELLDKAFTPIKKRRSTRPTKSSKLKRLKQKKEQAETKNRRKPPEFE
jgi:ribosome-associated protein